MLFNTNTLSLLFTSMLLSVPMVEGGNLRRQTEEAVVESTMAPTAVNLYTAGQFAILTKAGVTSTGGTSGSITGDIGSSPVAGSYYTGFGLIMDPSDPTHTTSSLVVGEIYAADYTAPTPSDMTTAISNMETAYTDAAGRSTPDFTELGAGNIEGKTLVPGLYKWGTSVGMTSALTFDGATYDINGDKIQDNEDAVWILQIAGDVIIGSGAQMILSGGAQAKNIFWQVAGSTIFGTTTQNKGVFLVKKEIVFQTSSSLNGAALSQTAVTLDTATIVKESVCDNTATGLWCQTSAEKSLSV